MTHAAYLEARSTAFRDHRQQGLLLVRLQGGIYSVLEPLYFLPSIRTLNRSPARYRRH
jgi:hypothetical protein